MERGGTTILRDVSLTLAPGDRIGLVGPNGVGKSTLLAALSHSLEPSSGGVETVPSDASVGLLQQELDPDPGETIAALVARRVGLAAASAELDAATEALSGELAALMRHERALDAWMRLGGDDFEARLSATLDEVGLSERLTVSGSSRTADLVDAAMLSGGEQARVGLAAVLLARFDLLLLDEPTNDLDLAGLATLERFIEVSPTPMIIVSHDRRFLERVVTAVYELDGHSQTGQLYNVSWASYLEARLVAAAEAERRYAGYRDDLDRLTSRARRQRQWAQQGVKAEKNPPDNDRAARGARIERTEKQASKARQTERALDRLQAVDKPWQPWQLQFSIGEAERSGDLVVELSDATVVRPSFQLGPISLLITAGERVAILGPNGHGKTTLLNALFGQQPLDSGQQRMGRSVIPGWLDQGRERLTTDGDFLARFCDETGLVLSEARALLAKFGLGPPHLTRPSAQWSPGERTRAVLAAFQASGVNTIILDEPTNHLDLPAIEQLEGALQRFAGTVLLISHDRAFLESVSLTRQLTVNDGRITADQLI